MPGGTAGVPESDSPRGGSLPGVLGEPAGPSPPQASVLVPAAGSSSALAGGGCATTGTCGSGKEELRVSGSAPSRGAGEQAQRRALTQAPKAPGPPGSTATRRCPSPHGHPLK